MKLLYKNIRSVFFVSFVVLFCTTQERLPSRIDLSPTGS
jgi:hypothetical protein